jgi:hypothetical protein
VSGIYARNGRYNVFCFLAVIGTSRLNISVIASSVVKHGQSFFKFGLMTLTL